MKNNEEEKIVAEALKYFRNLDRKKRLNCAQSVLKAFQKQYDIPDNFIDLYAEFGYGKAPEGYCGAFYAAKYLFEKENVSSKILEDHFLKYAGSLLCKEIRTNRNLSCLQCVEEATRIVINHLT